MYSENCQPTAWHRRWHNRIAAYGCVATGSTQVQLHHVIGACGKQDKRWIGQDYVIPLWIPLHDPHSNNRYHVGNNKPAFVKKYGTEKDLFLLMCWHMNNRGIEIPSIETIMAIRAYTK